MTDEVKNLVDLLLIGFNSLFAVGAFVMTLFINGKNTKIESQLRSIEPFLDRERDLRLEGKRMAREKSLAILSTIDAMFEKLKLHDEDSYKETNNYLRVTLRKEYFDAQIYLPNEISDAIFQFLASCIRAIGHFSVLEKYWDILDDVAIKYTNLTVRIRKTFYFETTDLAPLVDAEIAKFRPEDKKDAL
jgi:hypothetical protein